MEIKLSNKYKNQFFMDYLNIFSAKVESKKRPLEIDIISLLEAPIADK